MKPITKIIISILYASVFISCNRPQQADHYTTGANGEKVREIRRKIKHVIIIYEENWSFDGLYGFYPDRRVNNLLRHNYYRQVNRDGTPMDSLPPPLLEKKEDGKNVMIIDYRFTELNKKYPGAVPYSLNDYIPADKDTVTGDLVHRFYTEQRQINDGRMDKFVTWSDNGGLVMSYYDDTLLPEEQLAKQYTLCDNFFHSAFGGSFLNHIWFIAAATPRWQSAPVSQRSDTASDILKIYDREYTPDGYAVNTIYSVNQPHPATVPDSLLLPGLTMPTIGDRLNDAGITWAWYSGGWNEALKGNNQHGFFQYHHQPFVYFANYKDGSANKAEHLKDENDFINALNTGDLPEVSIVKPLGINNEHPGYAYLLRGQRHTDSLVRDVMKSRYMDSSVIIITYDENGGRWDHVAPPKTDRWGPGSRVPAIIISPFAKKNYVDSTQYETVSILKLIETLYNLHPLGKRDSAANNMLNAFDLYTARK